MKGEAEDRALGSLLGLAVGDALGTTLEFTVRDAQPSITEMVGGGPFELRAGEWTDDTALAVALGESLVACGGLHEHDLMQRFVQWRDNGDYSCTGHCFDVGAATAEALDRFERTGIPTAGSTDPWSAGNGSLMRVAPVVLAGMGAGERAVMDMAERQSATTHAAAECLDACRQFALILYRAISGAGRAIFDRCWSAETQTIQKVLDGSWNSKQRSEIRSTGYVVDSLEAALWSVATTTNFRDALVRAVNLGGDADTVGAISGQLAGALYGSSAIPTDWLTKLAWRERIESLGHALLSLDSDLPFPWIVHGKPQHVLLSH